MSNLVGSKPSSSSLLEGPGAFSSSMCPFPNAGLSALEEYDELDEIDDFPELLSEAVHLQVIYNCLNLGPQSTPLLSKLDDIVGCLSAGIEFIMICTLPESCHEYSL